MMLNGVAPGHGVGVGAAFTFILCDELVALCVCEISPPDIASIAAVAHRPAAPVRILRLVIAITLPQRMNS